jgi:hypothetical protein
MPVDHEPGRDGAAVGGDPEGEEHLPWYGSSGGGSHAELVGEAVTDDPSGEAVTVDTAVLGLA